MAMVFCQSVITSCSTCATATSCACSGGKELGPDYLRFALNLDTGTNQGSSFGLRAAYQKTLIDLGAELLATVGIGSNLGAGLDFYQPLDPEQRFFVEAGIKYEQIQQNIFQDNKRIAQYINSGHRVRPVGRHEFSALGGQARLSWIAQNRSFDRDIGATEFAQQLRDVLPGCRNARLSLDQLTGCTSRPGLGHAIRLFRFQRRGFSRAEVDFAGSSRFQQHRHQRRARQLRRLPSWPTPVLLRRPALASST